MGSCIIRASLNVSASAVSCSVSGACSADAWEDMANEASSRTVSCFGWLVTRPLFSCLRIEFALAQCREGVVHGPSQPAGGLLPEGAPALSSPGLLLQWALRDGVVQPAWRLPQRVAPARQSFGTASYFGRLQTELLPSCSAMQSVLVQCEESATLGLLQPAGGLLHKSMYCKSLI